MKSRDQILLEEVYQSIYEAKENYANQGVIFRKNGNKDVGCCIGVAHGKSIKLSKYLIERIHNISDLRFYAEGTAAKNPGLEPGMLPFLNTNFPGFGIESKSWDDITEEQKKGTANPKNKASKFSISKLSFRMILNDIFWAIFRKSSPLVFSPKLFARRQKSTASQSLLVSCNRASIGMDFRSNLSKKSRSCQFLKTKPSILVNCFSQKIHDLGFIND